LQQQFAPALILPAGHNPIHGIIAMGDAGEHIVDILVFFGGGFESHRGNYQ
jgi:hypothetical protein